MTAMTLEMQALKSKMKTTWESGDYGVFAKHLESGAIEFFDRLNIEPDTRLLDIACGAGQLTLPAARRGIDVTGLDLAANLVAQAQARAKAEGLTIRIDEGDAEELPYENASFDAVMSLFGAMFAPRPELVASEMLRVCRPGGKIAMGNWTPTSHVAQMFKIGAKYVPPSPEMPSPLLWGDEATCRTRFGAGVSELKVTKYLYPFHYPFSPAKVVDFFIAYYGPTNRVFASLDEAARTALHADLTDLWSRNNTATDDSSTLVLSEYAEVVGVRA